MSVGNPMLQGPKRSIAPVIFTVFLDLLGFGIVIPILAPLFLDRGIGILAPDTPFGVRTAILGALISIFSVMQFFGAPVFGALSDRYGRKPMLLLALGGTLVGYLCFAWGITTRNLALLFFGRALDGFMGGSISIANSAIADVSDAASKPRNFGLVGMAFGLGFILGPFIGGKLGDPSVAPWFTYATPFWFAAGLTVLNILLVAVRFAETNMNRRHTPVSAFTGFRNLAKAFRMKNLRTLLLTVFLLGFGFNFFTQFFQVFMVEKFAYAQSQIGDIFAYIGLWVVITQGTLTGRLAKRHPPARILEYSMLALGLSLPLLLVPRHAAILYAILPFIAVANGLTMPNTTSLVSGAAGPESQGEVMGLQQSIQAVAQAAPPLISGFVVALHVNLPIMISSLSVLAAWAVFMLFFERRPKETFHEV
uniref:Major facilitator superfamily protein n=1 Tax=uncultured bacterium pA1 TaxID=1776268 RepID=A0A0U3J8U9_9BACT|nr:major facilitator superfamily protein [uncultured bacterium pA1]